MAEVTVSVPAAHIEHVRGAAIEALRDACDDLGSRVQPKDVATMKGLIARVVDVGYLLDQIGWEAQDRSEDVAASSDPAFLARLLKVHAARCRSEFDGDCPDDELAETDLGEFIEQVGYAHWAASLAHELEGAFRPEGNPMKGSSL